MTRALVVIAVFIATAASAVGPALVNYGNVSLLRATMGVATPSRLPGARYGAGPKLSPSATLPAIRAFACAARLGGASASAFSAGRARICSGDVRGGAALIERWMRSSDGAYALVAGNARASAGDHGLAVSDWALAAPTPLMRSELAHSIFGQAPVGGNLDYQRCRDAIAVVKGGLRELANDSSATEPLMLQLADLYDALDDERSAIAVADQVLRLHPTNTFAADLRMIFLYRSHDDAGAIDAANRLLVRRNSWAAFLARGAARLNRCETTGAISDFRAALALPRPPDYRYEWIRLNLGYALWESGDSTAAVAMWHQYEGAQPSPRMRIVIAQAAEGRLSRRCRRAAKT